MARTAAYAVRRRSKYADTLEIVAGRGAAWLARQSGGLEVPSSNLGAPTTIAGPTSRVGGQAGRRARPRTECARTSVVELMTAAMTIVSLSLLLSMLGSLGALARTRKTGVQKSRQRAE